MALSTRQQAQRKRKQRLYVVAALAAAVLLYGLVTMLGGDGSKARKPVNEVVQLKLIKPPPPPPPPPPPKQKIEPPKQKVPEFKPATPTPEPPKQAPPPGPPALDAKGTGAGDAFGLQGKEGGADYRVGGGGEGGGGTGNRLGWYTTLLQQRAQGAVQRQRRLLEARFAITVQIWLAADGSTERVELLRSTGRPELDRLLKDTLKNMPKLSEPPPKDLPQPAVIRVTTT